jgi:hypothetical protein
MQLILAPQLQSPISKLLATIFPHRATYQHVLFMHQIYVTSTVGLTRVFPVLFAPSIMETTDLVAIRGISERIAEVVKAMDAQSMYHIKF